MPVNITHPGVHVEELSLGSRSIVSVSTSTTAFVGRTKWGAVNEPTIINSFGEFQLLFGGLWKESNLGYSVSDFFNNGGSKAVIVRLYKESRAEDSPPSKAQINIGGFHLEAANPGVWGEGLSIEIDFSIDRIVAENFRLNIDKMFNLTIFKNDEQGNLLKSERYNNLTIEDKDTAGYHNALRYDLVLENQSRLLRHKEGEALAKDLISIKSLVQDGKVKYSSKNSIAELEKKISELSDDKEEEKEKLRKKIISLKSSDGEQLDADSFISTINEQNNRGLYALEKLSPNVFNILVIPPYNPDDVDPPVTTKAAQYCERRKAFMIVDSPSSWKTVRDAENGLNSIGTNSRNAALYYPRIKVPDPLNNFMPMEAAPSGAIAGIYARTDESRGVWKAPAGTDAVLQGIELSIKLSDNDNGLLNPLGINCLRQFPVHGNIVWGARTLQGADVLGSEWKYVSVRRLALYIEQSIEQSIQWAVFEPNDRSLWSKLRLSISSFLNSLFNDGAFAGSAAEDAFFVKVDETTTTQSDIDRGVVNIIVGFAPLKPAEFIIIRFHQLAGQTS